MVKETQIILEKYFEIQIPENPVDPTAAAFGMPGGGGVRRVSQHVPVVQQGGSYMQPPPGQNNFFQQLPQPGKR